MWRLRGQRATGLVTVRAEWHEETRGQHHSEVRYGTFSRHIALPVTADAPSSSGSASVPIGNQLSVSNRVALAAVVHHSIE